MNAQTASDFTFDPTDLRRVFGQFATGVTVVTTLGDDDAPVGLAVNSFSSVSLDPPLVLWSIGLNTPSLSAFRQKSSFAINILCEQSKGLAQQFATPSEDKFAGVGWTAGYDGVPLLDQAASIIQCTTEARIPAGDHEIILGRVIEFHDTGKPPLVFHAGKFATLGDRV